MKLLFLLFSCSLMAYPGFQEPWGKDSQLKDPPKTKTATNPSVATRMADAVIRFHQQVLSPVDGPRSHFRPSSSQYMHLAMHRYGFLKGYLMGCDRLLRENNDMWVYRTIEIDGQLYKYDPAKINKYE